MDGRTGSSRELVLYDVEASDKWSLIRKMVNAIVEDRALERNTIINRELLYEAIVQREEKLPTGIGNGFAFPHARLENFDGVATCFAIPAEPIDFGATDGRPAEVVCLTVVQKNQPHLALEALARASRISMGLANRMKKAVAS